MESQSIRNKQKIAKLPEQVNLDQLKASSLMYNNGKRYSLISFGNNRESLFVQTPLFDGVLDADFFNEYGEYYFKINNDVNGQKFIDFIMELEKKIISLAFENKSNWFNKQENVRFRSILKNLEVDDNADEVKVIKFKIPYNTKTKRIYVDSLDNLHNNDTENISVKELNDGNIRMIININAIWFTDDMFGLYLRPVYLEEIKTCEYTFQDNMGVSLFIETETKPIPKQSVNVFNKIVENVKNEEIHENKQHFINDDHYNSENEEIIDNEQSDSEEVKNYMKKYSSDSESDEEINIEELLKPTNKSKPMGRQLRSHGSNSSVSLEKTKGKPIKKSSTSSTSSRISLDFD
jgi:hypothetical protein